MCEVEGSVSHLHARQQALPRVGERPPRLHKADHGVVLREQNAPRLARRDERVVRENDKSRKGSYTLANNELMNIKSRERGDNVR